MCFGKASKGCLDSYWPWASEFPQIQGALSNDFMMTVRDARSAHRNAQALVGSQQRSQVDPEEHRHDEGSEGSSIHFNLAGLTYI